MKWYNLYGPSGGSGILTRIKKAFLEETKSEEYFYFGKILAKAELISLNNKSILFPNQRSKTENIFNDALLLQDNAYLEYSFWLDLYQIKFSDSKFNNMELSVEYQYNNIIKSSEPAVYNEKKNKYYWLGENRRIKRVNVKMPKNIKDLPFIFLRIKTSSILGASSNYLGYILFDLTDHNLINNKQVRPTWMKMRKIETSLKKLDDPDNYVGDILCAFNCFINTDGASMPSTRPGLIERKNYKKFILISRIYMGKNFPKTPKEMGAYCELQFYNDKSKNPVRTKLIEEQTNPNWAETLFITAKLNENLELCENIKISAKIHNGNLLSPKIIGEAEIPVNEIEVYKNQNYIEQDIFKKARWYTLEDPYTEKKCHVLARFMLVMSNTVEKERITALETRKINPDNIKNYFLLFIIGLRNLPLSTENGRIKVKYDDQYLEKRGRHHNNVFRNKKNFDEAIYTIHEKVNENEETVDLNPINDNKQEQNERLDKRNYKKLWNDNANIFSYNYLEVVFYYILFPICFIIFLFVNITH